MLNKSIISLSLIISLMSHASESSSLAEAKKVLSEKEYKQYTHEIWQKDRKKAEVTDYSEFLKNNQLGNTLTVGPGNDCGFPNILTAINFSAPGDTIMIAEGTYTGVEAKLTINKSLSLIGGLDSNCQVFTINRTHLQLNDFGPVLEIDVSGDKTVTLSGLDISGAQHDNLADYDGGIYLTGNGTLIIENSHIHDNESFFGGGISVRNGAELILRQNTEIFNNSAISNGGGIFCTDSTIRAIDTLIGRFHDGIEQGNILTGDGSSGAGIYVNECEAYLGSDGMNNGVVEISYNQSEIGIGIHSINSIVQFGIDGSRMSFNETTKPLFIASGVAALIEGNSSVVLNNIKITDNSIGSMLRTMDDSFLLVTSSCDGFTCSEISRNSGRVIIQSDNSAVTIRDTIISFNKILDSFIFNVSDNPMNLDNLIISRQDTTSTNTSTLFYAKMSGKINIRHATIAANNAESLDSIFRTEDEGEIDFSSGIIWGNIADLMVANGSSNILVKDSIIQYPANGLFNTLQTDPMFVSENDFHIQFGSPAIDHTPVTLMDDIDGNARPYGGLSDAGADEWTDMIFKNGFEQ